MRIHTDHLSQEDIYFAVWQAIAHRKASPLIFTPRCMPYGSRKRAKAYEVRIACHDKIKGDGRNYLAQFEAYSATWEEWGHVLANIFELDPDATMQNYPTAEDFHTITNEQFRKNEES